MEIKVSTENGRVPVTVLHVDGNIDSSTYEAFQSTAKKLIDDGARYMLVDLSHAPFVSSAGLRALHTLFNELRSRNPARFPLRCGRSQPNLAESNFTTNVD